jgi:hypothetical protein
VITAPEFDNDETRRGARWLEHGHGFTYGYGCGSGSSGLGYGAGCGSGHDSEFRNNDSGYGGGRGGGGFMGKGFKSESVLINPVYLERMGVE